MKSTYDADEIIEKIDEELNTQDGDLEEYLKTLEEVREHLSNLIVLAKEDIRQRGDR